MNNLERQLPQRKLVIYPLSGILSPKPGADRECPILAGVQNGFVYYAHSYHALTQDMFVSAGSDYGMKITSVIWKNNIYGAQFHPEKSGKPGLRILENFLEL